MKRKPAPARKAETVTVTVELSLNELGALQRYLATNTALTMMADSEFSVSSSQDKILRLIFEAAVKALRETQQGE